MLLQVGESASSKSAMNTSAPELNALIIILRSTGPVISTWRFCRSLGVEATFQSPLRTLAVSGRNSNDAPEESLRYRSARFCNSSCRRDSNARCNSSTKASAGLEKTTSDPCAVTSIMSDLRNGVQANHGAVRR